MILRFAGRCPTNRATQARAEPSVYERTFEVVICHIMVKGDWDTEDQSNAVRTRRRGVCVSPVDAKVGAEPGLNQMILIS